VTDRLGELLDRHQVLFGVICRDPTLIDIELLAQTGYHIVWIDLEHGSLDPVEMMRLSRTITHLGMLPLVRIIELSRSHVQSLLDGGFQAVVLPNVTDANQAAEFVRLGKYPPLGARGLSSTSAGSNYTLGDDPQKTLALANQAAHLMAMFESDQGFAQMDQILQIDGIDLITVGPNDWAASLGLFGQKGKAQLAAKIDQVVVAAVAAGKIVVMGVSSPQEAEHFVNLGARALFLGVDVALKRKVFTETLMEFRACASANSS
jgi:2-keto-3-deoxy-L-rhamnonate aldolase RhmA